MQSKDSLNFIGLDIGGTTVQGALVSDKGKILYAYNHKTEASLGEERVLENIGKVIEELSRFSFDTFPKSKIAGIGAGFPGSIKDGGIVAFCPNLPLRNFNMKNFLEVKYKIPFFCDNDVNLGMYAELVTSYKDVDDAIAFFIGTGVGGAIIANREIYRGGGNAAEFGHILVEAGGELCGCGKRGCLEAYSSKFAIQNFIKAKLQEGVKSVLETGFEAEEKGGMLKKTALIDAYSQGDELAKNAVERMLKYLGIAAVSLVNILHPGLIIIGGGLGLDFFDVIRESLDSTLKKEAFAGSYEGVLIKKASLLDNGGVLGAALFAKDALKL